MCLAIALVITIAHE